MDTDRIKIRNAAYEDVEKIANLIYYTEVFPEDVWGGESKEECLDNLTELVKMEESRYSYRYATVAEKDGNILGAMITIPYGRLDSLSVKTSVRVIRHIEGIAEKLRYIRDSIAFMIFRECKAGDLYIANIATSKEARGLGVGKLLMAHAEKEAKRRKCSGISLLAKDEKVTKFYEKLNYKKTFDMEFFGERIIKMAKFV
ncbi:GNAT family N-acetyltransferase [Clostridium paraputrificum]|uniref:GNAT family N-acetyltransferase n=1 Tax=Clostridium TaxID=1485 RepID=UPI003D351BCF